MRVRPFFRWYDLWIGVFVDIERRRLYVCPFPMFGVMIGGGDDDGGTSAGGEDASGERR